MTAKTFMEWWYVEGWEYCGAFVDYRACWQAATDAAEQKFTSTNNERAPALDIVKKLAAWCERHPESSTSPWSGIEQFREIESAAKNLVESLNAETGTSPVS